MQKRFRKLRQACRHRAHAAVQRCHARHDPDAASPSLPRLPGAWRHGSLVAPRSLRTSPVPRALQPARPWRQRSPPSRESGPRARQRHEPPLESPAADRGASAFLRRPGPTARAWRAPAQSASPRAVQRRSVWRGGVWTAAGTRGASAAAGGVAAGPETEGGELTAGEVGGVCSSTVGAVKLGISRSVRTVSSAASVESSTAAAAAIGQRCLARLGAEDPASPRGRAFASRAAAARIAARVAGAGRSSSAALAAR